MNDPFALPTFGMLLVTMPAPWLDQTLDFFIAQHIKEVSPVVIGEIGYSKIRGHIYTLTQETLGKKIDIEACPFVHPKPEKWLMDAALGAGADILVVRRIDRASISQIKRAIHFGMVVLGGIEVATDDPVRELCELGLDLTDARNANFVRYLDIIGFAPKAQRVTWDLENLQHVFGSAHQVLKLISLF